MLRVESSDPGQPHGAAAPPLFGHDRGHGEACYPQSISEDTVNESR